MVSFPNCAVHIVFGVSSENANKEKGKTVKRFHLLKAYGVILSVIHLNLTYFNGHISNFY